LSENYRDKGERYITDGRLIITRVNDGGIDATCRGGGELYALGFRQGRWFCLCEARTTCSHLYALQLVTVRPEAASLRAVR
jgi:hypothetical protein